MLIFTFKNAIQGEIVVMYLFTNEFSVRGYQFLLLSKKSTPSAN